MTASQTVETNGRREWSSAGPEPSAPTNGTGLSLSVIIPVLNETRRINDTLRRLFNGMTGPPAEVIVVDGDPGGTTLRAITDPRVFGFLSPVGRGRQMNAGAAHARGDILLFLHADTTLPPAGMAAIRGALRGSDAVGGAFELGIDSRRPLIRLIERVGAMRSRMTRIPYGDQAIFLRRGRFLALGGFADIPLMEDVDLMRRIRQRRWPIVILPQKASTSARRWEQEGALYGTLRNWGMMILYLMGVPPDRLVRFYRQGK